MMVTTLVASLYVTHVVVALGLLWAVLRLH